ncbi:crinkler (CRN) family protein, putative [Rhizophagus clarus]|uniref:Crinkler (CRN) family protein, putative n=1 Tax=Rhizophagus clarus TaxID=94130 RepID=A0A8H3QRZ0_9GLOM|nr:crinkler (CRN) family protein, putative [Rhizophagus clarus]
MLLKGISDYNGYERALEVFYDILEDKTFEFSGSTTKTIAYLILTQQLLKPDQYILDLEYAKHQEDTNSEYYTRSKYIQCEDDYIVDICKERYCIINRTSVSYGDAFLKLDINLHNNPNEVHQYKKCTKNTFNGTNFINENKKSSSSRDFFLLFTITKVNNLELPENSGLIDSSNWRKYFGVFTGRAFTYANINSLNINTADKRDLQLVKRISETQADIIISTRKKRKLTETEKKILMFMLKKFKYE